MDFDFKGINKTILDKLSYESNLGKSLKKTLRRFEKDDIIKELFDVREFYESNKILMTSEFKYRAKALQSSLLKYDKFYPSTEMNKCFNDLLGIRIIVDNYETILNQDLSAFKVADMSKGKAKDDGYRGIHLYYQKSNLHYPIEIQINTKRDRIFNGWLHDNLYKYTKDNSVGVKLRELYDDRKINNIDSFKEEMKNVLSYSKEI